MSFLLRSGRAVGVALLAPAFALSILLTESAVAQILVPTTVTVQNGGTLAYTVTSLVRICGSALKHPLPAYAQDNYGNFVYTSVTGAKTNLTGSVSFLQNTSTSLGVCPINTPTPISLDGGGYLIKFTPGRDSTFGTAVLQTPVGYLNPKYVILGVTYAPPGPGSFVQYSNTAFLSTTNSITDSTSAGNSWSVSASEKFGIPTAFNGSITVTDSGSYTEVSSSASSFTLSAQTVNQTKTMGTPDAFSPVNHDYDVIWLWLNPVVILTANPTTHTITWDGYGVDAADQNVSIMDIWPVQVGFLNGHFGPLDPGDAQVLARNWAVGYLTWPSGQSPGLTQADFDQILLADPFASSSYTVSVPAGSNTTADGRFTIAGSASGTPATFVYKQANPGGTAQTQTLDSTYAKTSTQSSGSTFTTSAAFGIDVSFTGGVFLGSLTTEFKDTETLTWQHQVSTSVTSTQTTDAMLSITGPPCAGVSFPCTPVYNGIPSEFDVYQDNIYGTFMFNGVN